MGIFAMLVVFTCRMRECSEDLLVELSEILFNELAFFRLMQDLDGPKKRTKQQLREWRRVKIKLILVSLQNGKPTRVKYCHLQRLM